MIRIPNEQAGDFVQSVQMSSNTALLGLGQRVIKLTSEDAGTDMVKLVPSGIVKNSLQQSLGLKGEETETQCLKLGQTDVRT